VTRLLLSCLDEKSGKKPPVVEYQAINALKTLASSDCLTPDYRTDLLLIFTGQIATSNYEMLFDILNSVLS